MKYLLYICLTTSLLLLSACADSTEGNEQNKAKQDSDAKIEQDKKTNEQSDNKNDDDKKNLFSTGNFKTLKGKTNVGTYETGPLTFNIKYAAVKKGKVESEILKNRLSEDKIEFVEVVMTLESKEKNINFTEKNFQLTTNTGEKFNKPEGLMSTGLNIDFAYSDSNFGSGDYYVTVTYILDKTKAEDVEEVKLNVKAPTDENGNAIGEDLHVNIPVSKIDSQ
ncbi:hypothetical protein GLW20_08730 [Virgibacillus halodenitrificans]|nr:hypothetical protein [Virgibacillus halodenitrificans]